MRKRLRMRPITACGCALGISFIVSLALAGCGGSTSADSSATDAPTASSATAAPGPKVIVTDGGNYTGKDIVVGDKVHVFEGFVSNSSDGNAEGSANALISARIVGNGDGVDSMRNLSEYRHYGEDNQDGKPSCLVVDQDPIAIHTAPPDNNPRDGGVNGLAAPPHCKLDDGRDMYATGADP